MHTKIKTRVYVRKLQLRLTELKRRRAKALVVYEKAVLAWRRVLIAWIAENKAARVEAIRNADLRREGNRYNARHGAGFDTRAFFDGAPYPPIWPNDKQIRAIQTILRHLALAGAEFTVSTSEVNRYFSDEDEDAGYVD